MALIADTIVKTFDLTSVHTGDAVRVKRVGDTSYRNGLVAKITANTMTVIYSNKPSGTISYLELTAADVAVGVWEIYWTTDFITVNYCPGASNGGDFNG